MTGAPVKRPALMRLVWAATMPEGLAFIGPSLALLVFVGALAGHDHLRSVGDLAFQFQMPVSFLGFSLLSAGFLGDPDGRPKWANRFFARWDYRRRSFSTLGLAPEAAGAGPVSEAPGAAAVAVPMMAGAGAACLDSPSD